MTHALDYVLAFVLMLGVLIVVHEFGHYAVARLCGVKVLRFSIGLGRPVLRWRLGETEWVLGILPLGGYVQMLDEREAVVGEHDLRRAFNRQSVARRMAIVAAGPLANFVLAVLVYWGLFFYGIEVWRPILAKPPLTTAAAQAGIEAGEQVRQLEGVPVDSWEDFRLLIAERAAKQAVVKLQTQNERSEIFERSLSLEVIRGAAWEGDALARLGLHLFRLPLPARIGQVLPEGEGARAGLRVGDEVVAIDGEPISAWSEVAQMIHASAGETLLFTVLRDGQRLELELTPDYDRRRSGGRIGIVAAVDQAASQASSLSVVVRRNLLPAFLKAVQETGEKSWLSLVMLGKMLIGEVSWRNLSGPLTIVDYAGQSVQLGATYYLRLLALVSISLAVLNLLPIPVLDGGHLMYHVAEIVRGRPVSKDTLKVGQWIGGAILLLLMALALYNDFNRLFSG